MSVMDEREITNYLYGIIKEGMEARRTGARCKYNTGLKHMLHSVGWVREDLRIALMRSDPSYAASQAGCGQGLETIDEQYRKRLG